MYSCCFFKGLTMKFLINSLIVAILLIFTACSGGGGSSGEPTVSSVEIAPTSVMFTSPNQSMVLSAKAYDASGKELNVDINWSSSHTNIISIASDGNATAQGIIGSSLITAEVDGVKSAPVMVLVTELVGGAILVDDNQVIGNIELLDPTVPPGVGSQYKVTLDGLAPEIGDILVGTGELPIAGQVVSAVKNGIYSEVVLEIIPLDQMFTQLVINEVWDLGKITPYIPEEIANHYTVTEQADGTILFTPKSSLSALSTVSQEFEFTPFTCKLEGTGTVPTFSLSNPVSAISINRNFSLDLAYDSALGGFQKASVIGDLKAVFKAKPSLTANLNAKVSCDVELGSIPLPINPSLSWLLGFSVPLGVGFEVGGQLELAQLGADIDVNAHYIAEFGVECPLGNSCTSIHKLTDDDSTFKTDWVLPSGNIENNLRLKPEISGFGSAKLAIDIGNRYIGRIIGTSVATRFELIEAKGGLKQDADLAMIPAQVENTAYRSEYKLSIFSSIGAGSDINNWLSYVGMTGSVFEYQFPEILLASSPKALSATASQDQYNYGDAVTFTVELNQATVNYGFLGYNVDEISIYKRVPNAEGSYDYIHFFDMPATEGQTKFEREWVFTDDGNITDNFFAFVDTKFLPTFGEFGILEGKKITTGYLTISANGTKYDITAYDDENGLTYIYDFSTMKNFNEDGIQLKNIKYTPLIGIKNTSGELLVGYTGYRSIVDLEDYDTGDMYLPSWPFIIESKKRLKTIHEHHTNRFEDINTSISYDTIGRPSTVDIDVYDGDRNIHYIYNGDSSYTAHVNFDGLDYYDCKYSNYGDYISVSSDNFDSNIFEYNTAGKIIKYARHNTAYPDSDDVLGFTYNNNLLTYKDYYYIDGTAQRLSSYSYNGQGDLTTKVTSIDEETSIAQYAYTYDDDNRMLSMETSYIDNADSNPNRPPREEREGYKYYYTYDDFGNILSKTRTLGDGGYTWYYTYDGDGRLVTAGPLGNPSYIFDWEK